MMKHGNSTKILPVALVIFLGACGPGLGKGDQLAEEGDLEGAVKIYKAVYEKKETNKVALVKLGRTMLQLNEKKKDEDKPVSAAEWQETYTYLDRAKQVEPIPPEVDFNLWSGPATYTNPKLTRERFHYDWHWQRHYGNGDLGNQGPHQTDIARWGLGVDTHPSSVLCYGGRLGYQAERQQDHKPSHSRTQPAPPRWCSRLEIP